MINPIVRAWTVMLFLTVTQSPSRVTLRSQWDGVFTNAQAERGRRAYEQQCASCHGADLRGLPQEVRHPGQPARTPALLGEAFVSGWEGLSLGDLHERIRISMPQQSPGILGRQTVSDILSFMLREAGYPPGSTELAIGRGELAAITVLKEKP